MLKNIRNEIDVDSVVTNSLEVNSSAVINGSLSLPSDEITADSARFGSIEITGNMSVLGSTSNIDNLSVVDPLIRLNQGGTLVSTDVGIYADQGSNQSSAMFLDASDDTWKVMKDISTLIQPVSTLDTGEASYGDFRCDGMQSAIVVTDQVQSSGSISASLVTLSSAITGSTQATTKSYVDNLIKSSVYNDDDSLTSNRTITMAGRYMYFQGSTGSMQIDSSGKLQLENGTSCAFNMSDTGASTGSRLFRQQVDGGIWSLLSRNNIDTSTTKTIMSANHTTGNVTINNDLTVNNDLTSDNLVCSEYIGVDSVSPRVGFVKRSGVYPSIMLASGANLDIGCTTESSIISPNSGTYTSVMSVQASKIVAKTLLRINDGDYSLPSLAFESASDLGLYKVDSTTIGISGNLQVDGSLDLSGGTMTLPDAISFTTNITGFSAGGTSVPFTLRKVGDIVTMYMPLLSFTSTGIGTCKTASSLPTGYYNTNHATICTYSVFHNSRYIVAQMIVLATGIVNFYKIHLTSGYRIDYDNFIGQIPYQMVQWRV